ncbi:unnamed protein product [Rhizoctonia solani]|uniref:F-box domain-containing protein n=1 Tax=Rhizoctonia solani TaxID=456999 RepID=A0A8H3BKT5_9AGAM|nr:unnamed protein product [Rhizoctonia solani]
MPPTTRSSKRRATEGPLGVPEPSHLATTSEEDTYAASSNSRPDTPESEIEPDPKPSRKRARRVHKGKDASVSTDAPKRPKVKGKLEVFKNVPVEIAKYLHPFDLVLLSRVNKFFRELFMSRQAASIWISARYNVPGLPPCPPGLCEPQYAALLFTKMCSQCGKYAPRHMDPILLVRLCSSCRDEQFKLIPAMLRNVTDMSLVARSSDHPPRNFRHYGRLILSSDIETVESKLKELSAAGDKDNLVRWKDERRKELQDRQTNSGLFKEWFAARDSERETDLIQRKDAYEAEVEARLISLGWEPEDHRPLDNSRRKQWFSLVRAAKVLTDRTWDKLLPQLVVHLEENKKERLERGRYARKQERTQELHEFWSATKKQLPPLLQVVPQEDDIKGAALSPVVLEKNILHQCFPPFWRAHDWPEYTQLLDEDIPAAELKLKLQEKENSLNEFAQKWRARLEEKLIQQLPDHIGLPNFNAPGLSLTSNAQSPDSLFAGTQMLLRADVAFKRYEYDSCSFYPEDFQDQHDLSRITYDAIPSAIAMDLLRTLERPGATYLEMKFLGRVFQCGKCTGTSELMGWKSLVKHYAAQKSEWESLTKRLAAQPANEFTYIFTHDTKLTVENPNKPFVRIVKESEAPASSAHGLYGNKKVCVVCQVVGVYNYFSDVGINDHMRDAHLIEEPEQGKHFR